MSREAMEYDVVIVGAGPAGLAAAIRLKQLAAEQEREVSVCVLEKGSEVGAHILSGAVMDPRALNELIPDWKEQGAPLNTPVTEDHFLFLTREAKSLPAARRRRRCRTTATTSSAWATSAAGWRQQAEALGVEIFPGFAAAEVLYDEDGAVKGVATGDMGIGKDGEPTDNYQPGMELHAKYTIFAEGCRGHLAKQLMERFKLRDGVDPQIYGIGIKELWEIDPAKHKAGLVVHTAGWPLDDKTYGGSLPLPHGEQPGRARLRRRARLREPATCRPFEEFQRCKTPSGRSASISRAARASPTARGRSPRAASSRCRSWCSRAAPDRRRGGLPQRAARSRAATPR